MRRDDAVHILRQTEAELRARGVLGMSLFGSTARDEAGPDSDVDVLVELDMSRRPTLIDLSGVKLYIGDILGCQADMAIRENLRPGYRPNIEADAIRIF